MRTEVPSGSTSDAGWDSRTVLGAGLQTAPGNSRRIALGRPLSSSAVSFEREPSAIRSMSSDSRPSGAKDRDKAVPPKNSKSSATRSLSAASRWEMRWSRRT